MAAIHLLNRSFITMTIESIKKKDAHSIDLGVYASLWIFFSGGLFHILTLLRKKHASVIVWQMMKLYTKK